MVRNSGLIKGKPNERKSGFWAKHADWESIAQRSQKGELGLVKTSIGDTVGVWARISATEKHRTEVTEATEGELGLVAKTLSVTAWAVVRETRCNRKVSHRGHRGGVGFGGENLYWRQRGRLGEKSSPEGKASHRGARGRNEGGLAGGFFWKAVVSGREKTRASHREGRGAFPGLSFE
jgi:hypothetical protein